MNVPKFKNDTPDFKFQEIQKINTPESKIELQKQKTPEFNMKIEQ